MAATNHPEILDSAPYRRFDDVLKYELPDSGQAATLLRDRLANYSDDDIAWDGLGKEALGLSFAEAARAAEDVIKDALINGRSKVTTNQLRAGIRERHEIVERIKSIE